MRAHSIRLARRAVVRGRHLGVRTADVAIASYPKSGSTWLKFLLADLVLGRDTDFDAVEVVVPGVGAHRAAPRVLPRGGRLIKSHEPYRGGSRLFGRAIYVVRDGRDAAISYYFHHVRRHGLHASLPDFVDRFLRGDVDGYGTWMDHVASWLDSPLHDRGDLLVVRYEEMLADAVTTLGRVCDFVGLDASEVAIQAAVRRNTAARMRSKEATSALLAGERRVDIPFVRGGRAGDWRRMFDATDELRFRVAGGETLARLGYSLDSGERAVESPR